MNQHQAVSIRAGVGILVYGALAAIGFAVAVLVVLNIFI